MTIIWALREQKGTNSASICNNMILMNINIYYRFAELSWLQYASEEIWARPIHIQISITLLRNEWWWSCYLEKYVLMCCPKFCLNGYINIFVRPILALPTKSAGLYRSLPDVCMCVWMYVCVCTTFSTFCFLEHLSYSKL